MIKEMMGLQLAITDEASRWFHRELSLPDKGAGIRFLGRHMVRLRFMMALVLA